MPATRSGWASVADRIGSSVDGGGGVARADDRRASAIKAGFALSKDAFEHNTLGQTGPSVLEGITELSRYRSAVFAYERREQR